MESGIFVFCEIVEKYAKNERFNCQNFALEIIVIFPNLLTLINYGFISQL